MALASSLALSLASTATGWPGIDMVLLTLVKVVLADVPRLVMAPKAKTMALAFSGTVAFRTTFDPCASTGTFCN